VLRRWVATIFFTLIVGVVWFSFLKGSDITLSEATISKMPNGSFMSSIRITNDGSPDVLQSVSALGFNNAHVMGASGRVIIPGKTTVLLGGDGAHIMMRSGQRQDAETLVPVTLKFEEAAELIVRAKIENQMMDHSVSNGQEAAVSISLKIGDVSQDGLNGEIEIEGLELTPVGDSSPHVPGQGHAHLYLNGLKLGRIFSREFSIGPLLAGEYVLEVGLNTNDHRPYLNEDAQPVAAKLIFLIE